MYEVKLSLLQDLCNKVSTAEKHHLLDSFELIRENSSSMCFALKTISIALLLQAQFLWKHLDSGRSVVCRIQTFDLTVPHHKSDSEHRTCA